MHLFDIAVIAIGDRTLSLVLLFVRQSEKELRVFVCHKRFQTRLGLTFLPRSTLT